MKKKYYYHILLAVNVPTDVVPSTLVKFTEPVTVVDDTDEITAVPVCATLASERFASGAKVPDTAGLAEPTVTVKV